MRLQQIKSASEAAAVEPVEEMAVQVKRKRQ